MKLVSPVYELSPYQERIIEFQGLNRCAVINDGEMREMKNLSCDHYPTLTQRKPRAAFTDPDDSTTWTSMNLQHPVSMIEKACIKNGTNVKKLAVIDKVNNNYVFKYDGTAYTTGLTLSENTKMVAINSKICFFPEKKWFDVQTRTVGSIEGTASQSTGVTVTSDGFYQILTFTSSSTISALKADDAVDIYCSLVVDGTTHDYTTTPISCTIENIVGNKLYILDGTFLEMDEAGVTTASMTNVQIKRLCPNLAFVMEYNNRLWGVDNSNNEIRACKLGDPTNWTYYQGTSIDSYAATQGTDGEWTGLAAYSNHLLFFKEDYIHKLYGSKPSLYQIQTAKAFGVEKGSGKSVQIINDTVFYKSRIGIMVYEGGNPVNISEKFGDDKFQNVIAGTDGQKYYASMQTMESTPSNVLMVFDNRTKMWHIEDDTRVTDFCYYKGNLLMNIGNSIKYANADSGEPDMEWYAEFGQFDEYIEQKKVYSRIRLRFRMETGSTMRIKIKINDSPTWETVKTLSSPDKYTALDVPVVPRRCDKYSLRLEGIGKVKIESLTRQWRIGTDRRDVTW